MTAISNPASFHAEAMFQRVCAVCGSGGAFDAHHVVSKHALKKRGYASRLWDPRNALRLCVRNRCHERYTNSRYKIETMDLTDANICFIWEVLDVAGQNFLDRYCTGLDRRYTEHIEGGCPICQRPK